MITDIPELPGRGQAGFSDQVDTFITWFLNTFPDQFNADITALNLNSTTDTSSTSNSIATGAKTFTVSSGKSFQPGMYVVIADSAAPSTNSMAAQITSYSGSTLVVDSLAIRGSGTKTSWVISQSGNFEVADASVTGAKLNDSVVSDLTEVTMDVDNDYTIIADASDSSKKKKAKIPPASQTVKGAIEIATDAEVQTGTDTARAITPAGMRAGLNANGSAPIYACRAWVNFNGTGTLSIRASGNVSSVSDNGAGDYTINFITAMPDANYNFTFGGRRSSASGYLLMGVSSIAPTPSAFRVVTYGTDFTTGVDFDYVNVSIFR